MKRIVIISCYLSGQKEIDILNRCIEGYKQTNWDIMIVGHLPIDKEIANKVEYTIYDKNNTFLPSKYTPFYWFKDDNYIINIFNEGHTIPICRNMRAATNLAKAMEYDEFIFTEFDVILSKLDANKLVDMMNNMNNYNKKMLFFRPEIYKFNGSYVYETLMFGGNLNFFLDTFSPPIDTEQWLNLNMAYTLESSFYEKFNKYENDFLIINDHSSNIFTNSEVNVFRYGLFNCEMLYNEFIPEEPVLFINNSLIIEEYRNINIFKNDELISSKILGKNHHYINSFKLDDSEIKVEIYNIDKTYLFSNKKYILNQKSLPIFKERGIIKSN